MTEDKFGSSQDDFAARSEDAVTEAQNFGDGDRFVDPQTGESFPTALPPERRPAEPTVHLDEFGNRIPPNAPGYEHAGPYDFHSTKPRDHGAQRSAIQFIDVHKAFGRNKVLNGLNLAVSGYYYAQYYDKSYKDYYIVMAKKDGDEVEK